MKVYTYAATDSEAPAGAIARIWLGPGKKQGWHPVIFSADTTEAAQANAEAWWQAEIEKADKRRGPRKPKVSPAPAADVGDVI